MTEIANNILKVFETVPYIQLIPYEKVFRDLHEITTDEDDKILYAEFITEIGLARAEERAFHDVDPYPLYEDYDYDDYYPNDYDDYLTSEEFNSLSETEELPF